MNVSEFVAKWRKVELTERSASHEHFLDLCEVFDHPKPAQDDPSGERFTFERGADKHGGGHGWADVWKRGFFGWEYKGKHKDLVAAYDQLLKYREALENPPLLVVCDMDRFEIHTNFTATVSKTYEISLDDLDTPRNIEIMRNLFHEPGKLRPDATSEAITKAVAERLAEIAQGLRGRGLDAMAVARFLDRIVFCLFAEDVGLLPKKLFSSLVEKSRDPEHFSKLIGQLFEAMNEGGDFGLETIRYFNGNLFTASPVLELTAAEIRHVKEAARLDWSAVDPSIFGTLFQRGLDPDTRAQLGAQYTSREDIETLIEPVVMQPLRNEWREVKQKVEEFLIDMENAAGKERLLTQKGRRKAYLDATREPRRLLRQFHEQLCEIKVLDPACGSGNFLYVTLQKLKDLEKEVLVFAGDKLFESIIPRIGPWQFYGIEINPYAFELAQTTLWIGYLQWIQANGFGVPAEPILRRMDNFKNIDAILDLSDPEHPKEPEWPAVDFIVGNPPFLGDKKMRRELGDEYVEALRQVYKARVPGGADLVTYWFEKARKQIAEKKCKRAGLLATQGIRGGVNRGVVKNIKETGDIFFAESDRDWILDGANVHISMIGFDDGSEQERLLDGRPVSEIHTNLTSDTADTTNAVRLVQNSGLGFIGTTKKAPLDVSEAIALQMLAMVNPHGRPNSDVIVPYLNAFDVTRRNRRVWIIDYEEMGEFEAALYEAPFDYVKKQVLPIRQNHREAVQREFWWRLARPCPDLKSAIAKLNRFLVTTIVSKHRLFAWVQAPVNPDHQLVAFARGDDSFYGLLHSRIHEVWALKLGTRLETRPRYTPTTSFETFPFPKPTEEQREAIAGAAKELDELRNNWLNPPEWTREEILEFPGSVDGPWARYVHDANEQGIGTVKYPRIVPKGDKEAEQLAKRTLTNLYNERPTWLDLAHRKLDEAVFAAYGWDASLSDDEILARLLELNHERASA
jgi:type II restriction/modification system DNA methylase subunit YeeA